MFDATVDLTKVPWQLAPFEPEYCWTRIETVERGHDLFGQGYTLGLVYGATEKNPIAQLMVAAPVMLAALQFAAVKVRLLCQELGRSTDPDCQQIDDAIEKAGEEPPC